MRRLRRHGRRRRCLTDIERGFLEYLSSMVTPNRLATMNHVLDQRTRYITVVVEDIYQPHNASAVLRTCDAFGIQDVHIIENRNTYRVNPGVELGTAQWLTIEKHRNAEDNGAAALAVLKERGYRIIATTPHADDTNLDDFDLTAGKAALVFGNELDGISERTMASADGFLRIPMYGFVESFNISVSAAIILYHLKSALRRSGIKWRLGDDERTDLLLSWLRGSVRKSSELEKRYLSERGGR